MKRNFASCGPNEGENAEGFSPKKKKAKKALKYHEKDEKLEKQKKRHLPFKKGGTSSGSAETAGEERNSTQDLGLRAKKIPNPGRTRIRLSQTTKKNAGVAYRRRG